MTEKRYFKKMWEEEYYIFDSNTISESDFEEKLEYQDYKAFADSLMGDEVVDRLNELAEENQYLKSLKWNQDCINEISICIQQRQLLEEENEQLKKELKRLYDVATLNKAIEVLENKYDKMLSDGSDEVKDAMRHTVLGCIEDLDELKDDITAR